MKPFKPYIFFIAILFVLSCTKETVEVDGLAPIYISATDFSLVHSNSPQPYADLGNIVTKGSYIFINEIGKGIHVINNLDPSNPVNEYFWSIPGNTDFTIKGDLLYADNSVHLLVIDISDYGEIEVVNYTENIFLNNEPPNPRPIGYNGYFYCVDKTNGIHVGWSDTITLFDPLCEAF